MKIFTLAEQIFVTRTVGEAVRQAAMVLRTGHRVDRMRADSVKGMPLDERITTEKMSQLVETLVNDSVYQGVDRRAA